MTHTATVRLFDTADTAAIFQISADTAQYGDPVELILNDRRLFLDIFVRPYVIHFPQTCWVAEHEGQVVGYLTGCLDTAQLEQLFRQSVLRAGQRAITGHYRLGWRTLRAGIGYLRELLTHPASADQHHYPAHLHINLAAPFRGQGIGRRLMHTFLDHCRTAGIPGVHLNTSDQNIAALHLYRRLGFEVLHRYRSSYKGTVSRRSVDTLIMGLRLD
ncbi:MAG: GNAT family N-acetyltransferase [Anaerolineae bacterium]|nr:GNAT family N-acetyltransferase [Anaerolineae bacterium]